MCIGKRNRWDETPKWGETPRADGAETPSRGASWGETPRADRGAEAPTPSSKRRSRWDETPVSQRMGGGMTPQMGSATPSMSTPAFTGATPAGAMAMNMHTPSHGRVLVTTHPLLIIPSLSS